MNVSYMQVDQTLVFMVWMESIIEVFGMRREEEGTHFAIQKSEVDIMVIPLF